MILTAAPPTRINLRVLFRWLVTACALAGAVAVLIPPIPAQALESKTYGNVDIEPGEVRDEIYTAFGSVTVLGTVEGDVHTGSGNVLIDGAVDGDVKTGNGNVRVESSVDGDVKTGFGNVFINAPVNGDVDVGQGDVRLGPNARIAGDVLCASGNIDPHTSAVVGGKMISGMNSDFREETSRLLGFVGWTLGTLALMGCTVLAAVLMPGILGSAARQVEAAPVLSLALGAVSLPVAVVFVIILAVSIIGSPLIIFFLPAYGALVLFGAVAVSFFVGRRFLFATGRYRGGNALAAIVGALLVAAASAIPFVGPVLSFLLVSLGLGATILSLVARRRRAKTPPSYDAYAEDPDSVRG